MRQVRLFIGLIFLLAGGVCCVPSLHRIDTPPGLTFERPDWLGEEEWRRLLAGEVVLDRQQNFADLQVGRALVIMPVPLDTGWRWVRDPRSNPHFVERFLEHDPQSAEPAAPGSIWRELFDTGVLEIVAWVRMERDDDERTIRYLLVDHADNELRDFSIFIRGEPVSDPRFCLVTIGAYIETGWWWAPAFVERRVLRNTLLGIADEMRQNVDRLKERMSQMGPDEWFERGLHFREGRQRRTKR